MREKKKMNKKIISDVTEQGLLIPKEWLAGIVKVEILRKDNIIEIIPIGDEDPVFKLGTQPVSCGDPHASEEHDKHIYG